ncbi:MAG: hypothetical protein B7Y40_03060 [Gammaproteobacteria bacterium 28-57-27]|nr:MAG: hypothetical protein B7Y40_03060 [Gammaproteobacteria bacterium 28-57-27]
MNDSNISFPYDEFIDGLEEAIYWHNAWYSRGMRQLLLQTPASEDLIARDAHLHCKLAGFFGQLPTPPGHEELKVQIEELHQQMHTLMREVLVESAQGQELNAETLDELEEAQATFFITLHGLFRKVMEDRSAAQR